jgi:hypothetical protein
LIGFALSVAIVCPAWTAAGEPPAGFATAAARGDARLVRRLLAESPHADLTGAVGRRALLHAAAVGEADMVKTLLEHGVHPNARAKDAIAQTH